jgi:hypothetical protein
MVVLRDSIKRCDDYRLYNVKLISRLWSKNLKSGYGAPETLVVEIKLLTVSDHLLGKLS